MPPNLDLNNIVYPRTRWRREKTVNGDIRALLEAIHHNIDCGLHLGAGDKKIPGLINCDLHHPAADKKLNALELDSIASNTVGLIESHHMIEHLSFADCRKAVREWHRVLRPGGLLILTYPDITGICLRWLKNKLLHRLVPRREKMEYTLRMMVGSQEHPGMYHKSAFDREGMHRLLESAAFRIEFSYGRFPRRPTPSLITIARKPA